MCAHGAVQSCARRSRLVLLLLPSRFLLFVAISILLMPLLFFAAGRGHGNERAVGGRSGVVSDMFEDIVSMRVWVEERRPAAATDRQEYVPESWRGSSLFQAQVEKLIRSRSV